MTTEAYKTRSGTTQFRPVISEAEYRQSDMAGFCLACGAEADCCEPDTRRRPCEACGQPKVYGLEELLMMDLLKFAEDEQ